MSLIAALIALPSMANAQWKQIPCDQTKFKASVPFQRCDYNLSGTEELWTGAFHDDNSSAFVGVYTSRSGMLPFLNAEHYALNAGAYKVFFDKYPNRSDLSPRVKWLSFPAIVKTGQTARKMNCLQFFGHGPMKSARYAWISVVAMCVTSGEVPIEAADVVLQSIEVTIK